MDEVTWFVPFEEDLKHDRIVMRHGDNERVYVPEKKGKWIEKEGYDGDVYYDCSVCGNSWTTIDGTPWDNGMNYCPNCGARMEALNEIRDRD